MAEFTKLSEVEQIGSVSDNATVLVEDGGKIKRVSKAKVGGGGYVVAVSESQYDDNNGYFCVETNYDAIYNVLVAGGSVWIKYPQSSASPNTLSVGLGDATNWGDTYMLVVRWGMTDVGLLLMDWDNGYVFCPNGSHNLEPKNNMPS